MTSQKATTDSDERYWECRLVAKFDVNRKSAADCEALSRRLATEIFMLFHDKLEELGITEGASSLIVDPFKIEVI